MGLEDVFDGIRHLGRECAVRALERQVRRDQRVRIVVALADRSARGGREGLDSAAASVTAAVIVVAAAAGSGEPEDGYQQNKESKYSSFSQNHYASSIAGYINAEGGVPPPIRAPWQVSGLPFVPATRNPRSFAAASPKVSRPATPAVRRKSPRNGLGPFRRCVSGEGSRPYAWRPRADAVGA
ncbi:MAG TPA: hypothetical protein VG993_08970, partial [Actinomycetota bacterium]|nr:hypothetical protein [Actinomycetota bacterium]